MTAAAAMHFAVSAGSQGGAMFKLCVYYHGVLRYTLVAGMEKAQQLRDEGFYVVVKAVG
jgi:hypothetical protein